MGRKIGAVVSTVVFIAVGIYSFTQSKTDDSILEAHNQMLEIESATIDAYNKTEDRAAQAATFKDGATKLAAVDISGLPDDYQAAFKGLADSYAKAGAVHGTTPIDETAVQASLTAVDAAKEGLIKVTDGRDGIEIVD